MRVVVVAFVVAVAIAPRDGVAQVSWPHCSGCFVRALAVSPTSITFDAPLATNGAVPNAATNACTLEYRLVGATFNSKFMGKSAASFAASVIALPPSRAVSFRLLCDGHVGPLFTATTPAALTAAPTPPAVLVAKRIGGSVAFEFTSDRSGPSVFWTEIRATGAWDVLPDQEGTFASKSIAVSAPANYAVRVGVRNPAGIVYSAAVP